MDAHEPGHPDTSTAPVLAGDSSVRDRATGRVTHVDAWISERMAAESREREACLEELVNAVARGDLEIV